MSTEKWPSQAPHRTKEVHPRDGWRVEHPAFATASFSRISGGDPTLFGSGIKHQGYIRLTIHPATLFEDTYGVDRVYGHVDTLIEVNMSEAQFVSLITNMNRGSGTPVTLCKWKGPNGDFLRVPMIGEVELEMQRQQRVVDETTERNAGHLRETGAALLALVATLPKKKQEEAKVLVDRLMAGGNSNLAFASSCLKERSEHMLVEATQEVEAFIQARVHELGVRSLEQLAQLTAREEPRQIEEGDA